jgi:hypothetical protein
MDTYYFQVLGSPEDGFTSSEIYRRKDNRLVGRIFELIDGWYIQTDHFDELNNKDFVHCLNQAKENLKHYTNRKGAHFPKDWTRGQISLWLMQRDDEK